MKCYLRSTNEKTVPKYGIVEHYTTTVVFNSMNTMYDFVVTLFLLAGSTAMRLMECYTPASDNMDELCPMIQPRFDHGLVLCGDFLYACGGSININSKPLKHCEKYSHKLNK